MAQSLGQDCKCGSEGNTRRRLERQWQITLRAVKIKIQEKNNIKNNNNNNNKEKKSIVRNSIKVIEKTKNFS